MVVLKFYGPSLHGISIIRLQMGWTINMAHGIEKPHYTYQRLFSKSLDVV
jgi:hypothetical protein